ncbi:MAG: hypothetical protein H0T60_12905 [Acidobacteria bacterium]|nr:hypothetical protein [Acidobacteriota bacterium]
MSENENAVSDAPEAVGEAGGAGGDSAAQTPTETAPQADAQTAEAAQTESQPEAEPEPEVEAQPEAPPEEISYHAVEKDGQVTALWEMQGRKHLRTIDPRSRLGLEILRHYTADHPEETA